MSGARITGREAYRGAMDTATELFLLLTTDEGGKASWGLQTGWALSAAAIADLLLEGRVELGPEKDPRVRVVDATRTGRPVLDKVLARARQKDGARLSSLVQDRKANPQAEVVEGLVQHGVLAVEPARMFGLVAEKRPTLDPAPEGEIRARLRLVLAGGRPTPTDATLLAIVQSLGAAKKVLAQEAGTMSTKELGRRIEEACGDIAVGAALKRALDALNAAILTAVIVPAMVSGS